ncbi:MAG: serine/threonine-protein kinase [Myxococcota bacterium]
MNPRDLEKTISLKNEAPFSPPSRPDTAKHYMAQFLAELPQPNTSSSSAPCPHADDEPKAPNGINEPHDPFDREVACAMRKARQADDLHRSGVAISAGQRVGRYVVLEQLGHGGMGAVFKAYDKGLDRLVAIKFLHNEVNEDNTIRLKREAQALARLSHPNVVQVYEVGEATGQTFITMELVEGQTLREWKNEKPRGWRECVEIYLQAGQGLAAAHSKGLIHRDFKPDNVLIDGRSHVRVLDFGLARQTADVTDNQQASQVIELDRHDNPLETSLTETGTMMGTPGYMPPEQIKGYEANPRSDQFSYCVALWEAVYDERPFAGSTLVELMAAIRDEQITPSARGHAVPIKLRQILMRGLTATSEDRWPSMRVLLEQLAGLVTPRNRRWLSLGTLGGLATIGVGIWLGARSYAEWANRCTGAHRQLSGIWDDARREQVENAFVGTGLSYAPDAWERAVQPALDDYANDWTIQHIEACEATNVRKEQSTEMLDRRMACLNNAKLELDATVKLLMEVDAKVMDKTHEIVAELRPLSQCADVEVLAADTHPPLPEEKDLVAGIRELLAESKAERNAGRYAIAQARVTEAKEQLIEVEYGPVHTEQLLEEGRVLQELGLYEASENSLQQALGSASRWHQWHEMQQIANMMIYVVGTLQSRMQEGLRYRELAQGLAVNNPTAEAFSRHNVANILCTQGKHEEAEDEQYRALALLEKALGPGHPRVADSRNTLAIILYEQGKYEQAELEQRRALASLEEALGPKHPHVANSRANFAATLHEQGHYREAEHEHRRALALREEGLGPDHPLVAESRVNLAAILHDRGRYAKAEQEHRHALVALERSLGPKHLHTAMSRANLATTLGDQGRYLEAEQEHRGALALLEEILGPEHAYVAMSLTNLGNALHGQGRFIEAETLHRRSLKMREEALGPEHPQVAYSREGLASALYAQKRYVEAEVECRHALKSLADAPGSEHPLITPLRGKLAVILGRQGRLEEAKAEHQRVLARWERTLGPEHPYAARSRSNLAEVLLEQGHAEHARRQAEQAWTHQQRDDIPAEHRAQTAFVLARALWPDHAQRARARTLAERARDGFAAHGQGSKDQRLEVERWLRHHRAHH